MRGACLRSRVATVFLRLQQQRRQQSSRKHVVSSSSSTSTTTSDLRRPRPRPRQHQFHHPVAVAVAASASSSSARPRKPSLDSMKPHATAEGKPENSNGDKTLPPPPPPPTRVLLTNDDGPLSPFFVAWVEHVRTSLSWRAFAAPPAEGQSFVSKAVATGSNHARSSGGGGKPSGISLTRVDEETVHVSGPPATAVNLALHHLATDCDFVVSGPNVGHNVGRGSVLSSGTVGAALEGAVAGRKSVALSFPFRNGFGNWTDEELRLAVEASGKIVADLWENWGEGVDLYNVNVPLDFNRGGKEEEADPSSSSSIPSNPSPFRVATTTVDPGAQYSSLYKIAHPDSEHDFEWGPSGLRVFEVGTDAHPGGDVEAVREGRISVTPLRAALAHVESKQ